MLELRNVSKRFPGVIAVDNVSFSARAEEEPPAEVFVLGLYRD